MDLDTDKVCRQVVEDVIYFINGEIGLCFNDLTPEKILRAMTLSEMKKALEASRENFKNLGKGEGT